MISRFLVISLIGIMLGTTSLAEGNINGKIITDFKFFPNNNVGTIGDSQSLELNIDAYKDFGPVRGVLELIARTDTQDSGRRILESRQAYLKTDIFDSIIFFWSFINCFCVVCFWIINRNIEAIINKTICYLD